MRILRRVPWELLLHGVCRCKYGAEFGAEKWYAKLGECQFSEETRRILFDEARWVCACGGHGYWMPEDHCVYHGWRWHALRRRDRELQE